LPAHRGLQRLVRDLNRLYRDEPALHVRDCEAHGLEWIEANDADQSVFALARVSSPRERRVVIALNFAPVVRRGYRIGVDLPGRWREVLNTDAVEYEGSGVGNLGGVESSPEPWHGHAGSLALTLPPLAAVFLRAPDPA